MNSITDKLKGATNQVVGAVKQAAGLALATETSKSRGRRKSLRARRRRPLATQRTQSKKSSTRLDGDNGR